MFQGILESCSVLLHRVCWEDPPISQSGSFYGAFWRAPDRIFTCHVPPGTMLILRLKALCHSPLPATYLAEDLDPF